MIIPSWKYTVAQMKLDQGNEGWLNYVFKLGTSVIRAFGPGYFCHSASILESRHIGVRPKGGAFWSRLSPEAIKTLFCIGCRGTRAIGSIIFFLIKNFARPLASVMVRTEAIYPVSTHQQPSIINKPILFRFTHFPVQKPPFYTNIRPKF